MWWPYDRSITYAHLRERVLHDDHEVRLLPINTTSEEEAYCSVRVQDAPDHGANQPTDRFPVHPVPEEMLARSSSSVFHRLAGCVGYTSMHTSLYLLMIHLVHEERLPVFTQRKIHLYTWCDTQGRAYTFLYHVMKDWLNCSITGYPYWVVKDDDLGTTGNSVR